MNREQQSTYRLRLVDINFRLQPPIVGTHKPSFEVPSDQRTIAIKKYINISPAVASILRLVGLKKLVQEEEKQKPNIFYPC